MLHFTVQSKLYKKLLCITWAQGTAMLVCSLDKSEQKKAWLVYFLKRSQTPFAIHHFCLWIFFFFLNRSQILLATHQFCLWIYDDIFLIPWWVWMSTAIISILWSLFHYIVYQTIIHNGFHYIVYHTQWNGEGITKWKLLQCSFTLTVSDWISE